MTISMYAASVPVLSATLNNLSHVLSKGEADAVARKIDPTVFVNSRLAPDMLPLKRQVTIATDHAKGAALRLAGKGIPSWPDTEETFADLQARLAKARDYLATFTEAQIDGSEGRDVVLKIGGHEMPFTGQDYLLGFVLPNFFFHVTAAYAILRHNGVPLGKADFFGQG
jgi:uncharacterized protein